MTVPSPAQLGHGDTERNCPNNDCAWRRTSPVPPHVLQVFCFVPGFAPEPLHVPQRSSVRTRTVSPLQVAPQYRARYNSLIEQPQGSGAGVFLAERHCLLGIVSQKLRKFSYRKQAGRLITTPAGEAGYYVPASAIAEFVPAEMRF